MTRLVRSDQAPIIAVRNFTAAYDGNVLLENLSFDVYPGEVFVILEGPAAARARCSNT